MKGKAEVCHGDERCREKFMLLLAEIGFPAGLLALQHIEECGYVKEVGFVWLRLQKEKEEEKKEHRFENVCCGLIVWSQPILSPEKSRS
ncbi:hypothetical protein LWI28_016709 [Acer negundo]|uniref:Uncharacterized protein n=1 Tax=Acer negundo TaxID=4023 RepID=A0AAD5JL92_ACENE|nr:hypothetical protein LWI28_016709 [Acer negundo]